MTFTTWLCLGLSEVSGKEVTAFLGYKDLVSALNLLQNIQLRTGKKRQVPG